MNRIKFKIGQKVKTIWDNNKETTHIIGAISTTETGGIRCQSGIAYQLIPPLRLTKITDWIDQAWLYK